MATGIGQQNRITAIQEQQRITTHTFAIVSKAMQENYGAAIEILGMHIPAFEHSGIRGGNTYLLQLGLKLTTHQRLGLAGDDAEADDAVAGCFRPGGCLPLRSAEGKDKKGAA